MVLLRNVKLCTATIVYWCQRLMLYFLCSMGKNWFFPQSLSAAILAIESGQFAHT